LGDGVFYKNEYNRKNTQIYSPSVHIVVICQVSRSTTNRW